MNPASLLRLLWLSGIAILALGVVGQASAQSSRSTEVIWDTEKILIETSPGVFTRQVVEFYLAGGGTAIDVTIAPELKPLVRFYPDHFDSLGPKEKASLTIMIAPEKDLDLGNFDGILGLKSGNRILPTPLPIEVFVDDFHRTELPDRVVSASADRIAFDLISELRYVSDELLVWFEPAASKERIFEIASEFGGRVIGGVPALNLYQIQFDTNVLAGLDEFQAGLGQNPYVSLISLNTFEEVFRLPADCVFGACNDANWSPELAKRDNMEPFLIADLPRTWDIATGSRDFKIGVVDTGFFHHLDFLESGFGSLETNFDPSYHSDSHPWSRHGTAVLGVLGARPNNLLGSVGAMWDVNTRLCAASSESPDHLERSLVTQCFADLIDREAVRIINYSAGSLCDTNTAACRDVESHWRRLVRSYPKVLFVVAAGQVKEPALPTNLFEGEIRVYPASLATTESNVVAVMGIDDGRNPSRMTTPDGSTWWTNYGEEGAVATWGDDRVVLSSEGGYAISPGTSLSAPLVSGVAGLMLSVNPHLSPRNLNHGLQYGSTRCDGYAYVTGGASYQILSAFESVRLARNTTLRRITVESSRPGNEMLYNYSHDRQGRILAREDDFGRDGVINRRLDYFYNDDGLLEEVLTDLNHTGSTDIYERFEYDAKGFRIKTRTHDFQTGRVSESFFMNHSVFGYPISEEHVINGPDGVAGLGRMRFTYSDRVKRDCADRQYTVGWLPYSLDRPWAWASLGWSKREFLDQGVSYVYENTFNGDGFIVRKEVWLEFVEWPDFRPLYYTEEFTYDPKGRVSKWFRTDEAGDWDIWHYEYVD